MIAYQGRLCFDDRIFVLYLCKVVVSIDREGFVTSTIYHEKPPDKYSWCIVTYWNCNRYPLFSIKLFDSENKAVSYLRKIEPETPLVSLAGKSTSKPLSYEDYVCWKNDNNLKGYDYKEMYTPGGTNPSEKIYQTFDQFLDSNPEWHDKLR